MKTILCFLITTICFAPLHATCLDTLPVPQQTLRKPSGGERFRRNAIYIAPALYLNGFPFGAMVFFDSYIYSFSAKSHIGASLGWGYIDGFYSEWDGGPILRAGPKLYFGRNRKQLTAEIQYFRYNEGGKSAGSFAFNGLFLGMGYAGTGKSGFFFHPKLGYLFSMNETSYGDKIQLPEVHFGFGYCF